MLEEPLRHGHGAERALYGGPWQRREEAEQPIPRRSLALEGAEFPGRRLERQESAQGNACEAKGQPGGHDGQHAGDLREDRRRRPAAQHAEKDELAEDPHATHDALHSMENLAVCDMGEEGASDYDEQLGLEHGARGKPYRHHRPARCARTNAEGDEGDGQHHEEGLVGRAGEDLLSIKSEPRSAGNQPATCRPQYGPGTDSGDDPDYVPQN
mmetsp:Transcript_3828/g.11259  ORF Transcript_3828/g.11259 Transcript_3828/m.11259 type:complete len:212 (+) Transcript_3828:598-1233(+)